jgi:hypothetical protein
LNERKFVVEKETPMKQQSPSTGQVKNHVQAGWLLRDQKEKKNAFCINKRICVT